MRFRVALVAVLALTFAQPAQPAQDGRAPRFEVVSVEDGLPHANVYAVAQGPKGFIWLATEGGLARYDGRAFHVYEHERDDPASIASNEVSDHTQPFPRVWPSSQR